MSRYNLTEPYWIPAEDMYTDEPESFDDSMDGDHESALASAGFGTDEDYGSFGGEDDWLDGSYEDA